MAVTLYSYWRSSAAYRVRIALNLKGIEHNIVAVDLAEGEHRAGPYAGLNPQRLVPFLEDGDRSIAQSVAIIEYLDEAYRDSPLYPVDTIDSARVRSFVNAIACDIHPLNNLRVLRYLKGPLERDDAAVDTWYAHWIHEGFAGLEKISSDGPFVFGDVVTAADVFLVPQMYNARRFNVDVTAFPKLVEIDAKCLELDAFRDAVPESQPDAP